MYAYTALHTYTTPLQQQQQQQQHHPYFPLQQFSSFTGIKEGSTTGAYIFVRNFCLPFQMTEADYKEYLATLFGTKANNLTVRYYEWGQVPPTFQTSILSLPHEKGTIEGLPYDLSMTSQDISAYVQFVQDSVALERRRPQFTPFKPRSLASEPEYAGIFESSVISKNNKDALLQNFESSSVFKDTCASSTDHTVSFDAMKSLDVPSWCTVITHTRAVHGSSQKPAVMFSLHAKSDMAFLQQATEPFMNDYSFYILFNSLQMSETLDYNFDDDEFVFRNQYRGTWTIDNLHRFFAELLRKDGLTLLQLSNGGIVRERADGFWEHMIRNFSLQDTHVICSLSLRLSDLTYKDSKKTNKETKKLEANQVLILSEIMQKAPSGLSLFQLFNMFQTNANTETETKSDYYDIRACKRICSLPEIPYGLWKGADAAFKGQAQSEVKTESQLSDTAVESQITDYFDEFYAIQGSPQNEWVFNEEELEKLQTCAFLIFLRDRNLNLFSQELTNYCWARTLSVKIPLPNETSEVTAGRISNILSASTEWLMEGSAPYATKLLARFHLQLKINPSREIFRTIVGIFSARCLESTDDKKITASQMWNEFQIFLQTDTNYPSYTTSQQSEFNETLTSFGFEQKRTSAGKIWLNVAKKIDT